MRIGQIYALNRCRSVRHQGRVRELNACIYRAGLRSDAGLLLSGHRTGSWEGAARFGASVPSRTVLPTALPACRVATLADLPTAARWLLASLSGRAVVLLEGEMGAGKTTFVRAIADALGVADHVSSPTYGLVHEYRTAAGTSLYHFDLYRLRTAQEALDLGIFDYLDAPNALSLLEWPERLGTLLPEVTALARTLTFTVDPADDSRTLTLAPLT